MTVHLPNVKPVYVTPQEIRDFLIKNYVLKPVDQWKINDLLLIDFSQIEYPKSVEKLQVKIDDVNHETFQKIFEVVFIYDPKSLYKTILDLPPDYLWKIDQNEFLAFETLVFQLDRLYLYLKSFITYELFVKRFIPDPYRKLNINAYKDAILNSIQFNPEVLLRRFLGYIGGKKVITPEEYTLNRYHDLVVDYLQINYHVNDFKKLPTSLATPIDQKIFREYHYTGEEQREHITLKVLDEIYDEILGELDEDEIASP